MFSALTNEEQQTHADGEDRAGTEGGQSLTFDLSQLAALTLEALLAPAPVTVGRQRQAGAAVTAGGRPAGRRHAALLSRVVRHCHLSTGTPGGGRDDTTSF